MKVLLVSGHVLPERCEIDVNFGPIFDEVGLTIDLPLAGLVGQQFGDKSLDAIAASQHDLAHAAILQNRLQNLADALDSSQRAVALANQRYRRGLTDFLNVTDAERQLYELQDQYAVAQEDAVVQFIAVYKGLGGGWENYQNLPPAYFPKPAVVAEFTRVLNPGDPLK